jgi:FkbM family methyltransferase
VGKALLSIAATAARWLPAPIKRTLYRLGSISSALREALNRAAPRGLSEVEVAGGLLTGTRLLLDMQAEKDYWLGTYEVELQQAIQDLVKPGMVAYDLGANIGYVSLVLTKQVGKEGRVFAFEPLPANQERLRSNLALNPELRVELVPTAATDVSGRTKFLVHASGGMGKVSGSDGRNTQYDSEIEVETTSIDDFVFMEGKPKPDLLKIDIEGGEGLALQGMKRLIDEHKPIFIIELHGEEAAKSVWDTLKAAGYLVRKLQKGYPEVKTLVQLDWKSYILARRK